MVRASIAGGFVLVPVASLMAAWRSVGIGDFRAWLACREMVARRCGLEDGRAPAYTTAELARLLGVTEKRAKSSTRRLEASGLMTWSIDSIRFHEPDAGGNLAPLGDSIGQGRGSVVLPRRLLRLLAGGARPALIATALAILLRCLSRRRGGFDGRGRVKASWVADVFGIDVRRVKAARLELVALGWIEPEPSTQSAMNRWGACYRIALDWDRADGRRLAPPPAADRPAIGTPSVDQYPLSEREENQEPAGRGPAGVRLEGTGKGGRSKRPPRLDAVRPEDLRDVGRTLELYRQAVERKLVVASEDGRLRFLAVSEHARAVGTVNPCGLFARLVRRGWWHFATQDDEDVARRKLREHLHGPARAPEAPRARRSTFVPDTPGGGPSVLAVALGALAARFGGAVRPG